VNTTLTTNRPRLRWLASGLAVGMLAAAIVGPGAVLAQSDPNDQVRSISVSGVGRVKAEPDIANVSVGVTKQGKDAGEASQKAAKAMDAVIKSLLDLGIAENDMQTTSLNLNPTYDWDDNPPNIVGWEASNMVNITVRDIEAVGDVVDTATKAGATNVNGISFRVEDPTMAEAEARAAAVAAAESKAQQLAVAAGVNIIGVLTITESGGQQPQPIYLARSEASFDTAAASTPVLPGEVELSISVFMQYEIE
jgi:uncharacterized protein YggE